MSNQSARALRRQSECVRRPSQQLRQRQHAVQVDANAVGRNRLRSRTLTSDSNSGTSSQSMAGGWRSGGEKSSEYGRRQPAGGMWMAWTHQLGNNRVLYFMLGRGPKPWSDPSYSTILARGMRWAPGRL